MTDRQTPKVFYSVNLNFYYKKCTQLKRRTFKWIKEKNTKFKKIRWRKSAQHQQQIYPILQCLLSFLYLIIKIVSARTWPSLYESIRSASNNRQYTPLLPLLLKIFFSLFNNFYLLMKPFLEHFLYHFIIFCCVCVCLRYNHPPIHWYAYRMYFFAWMKGKINSQREFRKNYCKFDADKEKKLCVVINLVKNELAEKKNL